MSIVGQSRHAERDGSDCRGGNALARPAEARGGRLRFPSRPRWSDLVQRVPRCRPGRLFSKLFCAVFDPLSLHNEAPHVGMVWTRWRGWLTGQLAVQSAQRARAGYDGASSLSVGGVGWGFS